MENAETDRLLEVVDNGSASQREAALAELVERAQRTDEVDDWNVAGLGFHRAGDHYRAIEILEALIANDPAADSSRLTLATCYSQIEGVEQCRQHLRHLAAHASTEGMRKLGREQLEGYENFLGRKAEERGLRLQRIQALRRLVTPWPEGSLQATVARLYRGGEERKVEAFAYDSLARNLFQESKHTGDEDMAREALAVCERGTKAYPENAALFEGLVACYLRYGPEDRLNEALSTLKRLAPDSEVLRTLVSTKGESWREFIEEMNERVVRLWQIAKGEDPALKAAAIADLRRIVAQFPNNRVYREKYAWALLGVGEKVVALDQAERLANDVPANHPAHFNLGQIFWHSGDPKRGRHHLELSLHYAESDDDRRDVHEAVATCEHWYGKEPADSQTA
jgi:tetratricopeptide (TPR) repeat protein